MRFQGILIFTLLSVFSISFSQTIRINEFMALNQTVLTDEDGEYSDWIEIYNPSGTGVDLQGYGLSDEPGFPHKWIFPDITISAGEYLIIFASGKDRSVADGELHTNFKLGGSGEYLALFNPTGDALTEFSPSFPPQQTDYSYGYFEDNYIEFSDPTPGEDNSLSSGTVIPPPEFNIKHGFFESPINLVMTSSVPTADIYYTTDGSEPSESNGILYTSPINISTTSIIRAAAIVYDEPPSKTITQTYLFLDDVIHQPNNPAGYPAEWGPYTAIPGNAIADYEMDPEMMADGAFASKVKEALKDIPTLSLVSDKGNFFSHEIDPVTGGIYIYTGAPGDETGLGWERPVSAEYFNSNDAVDFQVNCGIRLQGGHSRRPEKDPKHSFLLVFKSEYGPSRLNYPIFGEEAAQSFNNLILRAGFGLSWLHWTSAEREKGQLQRDAWTKDAQRAMGHPSSNSIYVHLYINGIYWGVYAPSERMDADYAVSYFGGDETDYDVIKDYMESGLDNPAVDGTTEAWDEMIGMVNAGLANNEAYQAIQGNNPDGTPSASHKAMIDMVNFADYMLLNYYGSNTDWDHHNWAAIRSRVKPDKGFKFFCWDAEHMIKSVSGSVLSLNNDYCPSRIFQKSIENEDFRRLFADRVAKHCFNGGVLTPEGTAELWSNRRTQVEKSMDAEAARWGDYRRDVHPYSTGPYELYTTDTYWLAEQNLMADTYFPQRTSVFVNQLRNAGLYPQVDAPVFLINGSPVSQKIISEGDILSMTSSQGTIYYTTDGSDPVVWQSSQGSTETVLISESTSKRVLVPKSDIGNTWLSDIGFDDYAWQLCSGAPGGVGYEMNSGYEDYITLDVSSDMYTDGTDPNTSCYVRIPFTVSANDLSTITSLILGVRYDDGFVAYLNGEKVAQANAPASPVWNSVSSAGHEANSIVTFNISDYVNDLHEGDNLLAIQALNASLTSSDFIISATLTASDQTPAGNISESAVSYSGELTLNESSHIIARTFYNGEWSASNNQYFILPANYLDLKITEIQYNPLGEDLVDGGQYEFIEIKNTGTSRIDLGGLKFVQGIEFTFPPETGLGPGEFLVLASNNDYFNSRYGFFPYDEFGGKLNNDGEWLVMLSNSQDTIIAFRYNDGSEWPQTPDGVGNSLVPVDLNPANDQNSPTDWRASYYIGGSPGADDLLLSVPITEKATSNDIILSQNYPNPFNDVTYIDYQLSENAFVKLSVYNLMGQRIVTLVHEQQTAGLYQVEWNGIEQNNHQATGGMYFYRIEVQSENANTVITKKMMLLK
jgi:hypothetical protein